MRKAWNIHDSSESIIDWCHSKCLVQQCTNTEDVSVKVFCQFQKTNDRDEDAVAEEKSFQLTLTTLERNFFELLTQWEFAQCETFSTIGQRLRFPNNEKLWSDLAKTTNVCTRDSAHIVVLSPDEEGFCLHCKCIPLILGRLWLSFLHRTMYSFSNHCENTRIESTGWRGSKESNL